MNTKTLNELPMSKAELSAFREDMLQNLLKEITPKIEASFPAFLEEASIFFADDSVRLHKSGFNDYDLIYLNNYGIIPDLDKFECQKVSKLGEVMEGDYIVKEDAFNLDFAGFKGDLISSGICNCLRNSDDFVGWGNKRYRLVFCYNDNRELFLYSQKDAYYYEAYELYLKLGNGSLSAYFGLSAGDVAVVIPYYPLTGGTALETLLGFMANDLIPDTGEFSSDEAYDIYVQIQNVYKSGYGEIKNNKLVVNSDKIYADVVRGEIPKFLKLPLDFMTETAIEASDKYMEDFRRDLLEVDYRRVGLDKYDPMLISEPNRGHWDLWDYATDDDAECTLLLNEGVVARDPAEDVNLSGLVGIDFGTKNTVVVYENERGKIMPLQVGSGSYAKGFRADNYENPTVIRLLDSNKFLEDYKSRTGRPRTSINDVTVSHDAATALNQSENSGDYSTFIQDIKAWCANTVNTLTVRDLKGAEIKLKPFGELKNEDLDPLEIYAYYLGSYINHMLTERHIFLRYFLSFPVTYEEEIREKMKASFERGIKKSLPSTLLSNEGVMKQFSVEFKQSEPAAYAVTALKNYGFPKNGEDAYYAVFDFGGGTTDFDFGVYKDKEIGRFDYELTHFGASGDRTLGGENLLRLMAFHVFKNNLKIMRGEEPINKPDNSAKNASAPNANINEESVKKKFSFTYAAEKEEFPGQEAVIRDSQEAGLNMRKMMEKLRPLWENPEGENAKAILKAGKVSLTLFNDEGKPLPNVELTLPVANNKQAAKQNEPGKETEIKEKTIFDSDCRQNGFSSKDEENPFNFCYHEIIQNKE